MAIKGYNVKTLSQIKEDALPLEFYITEMGFSYAFEDEPAKLTVNGLMIINGDIDDAYTWGFIYYAGGLIWFDGNASAHQDEVKEVIEKVVKPNSFVQSFKNELEF